VAGKSESRYHVSTKLPETPDEWREKVSPVHVFPRFRFSNGTTRHPAFRGASTTHRQKLVGFFSKSRVIFKKPTAAKKAESFSKRRRRLFGAKNRQMSQL
jgi:hypothetical protein